MILPLRHLALLSALALLGSVAGAWGQTLASGEVLSLTLEHGDVQVIEVEVPNHRRIVIQASSEAFSPFISLHLPGGVALTARGSDTLSHVNCCRATTLRLSVRSTEPMTGGDYSLVMKAMELDRIAEGVALRVDERVEGRLGPGDQCKTSGAYTDPYVLNGEIGDRVVIDLASDDFDPFLQVKCPCGRTTEDDDSGPGLNSRLIYRFHEGGPHRIDATSVQDMAMGDYTLTVTRP